LTVTSSYQLDNEKGGTIGIGSVYLSPNYRTTKPMTLLKRQKNSAWKYPENVDYDFSRIKVGGTELKTIML
jgi:hypothetical protein